MFGKGDFLILFSAFISLVFSISLWFGFGLNANHDAGVFVGLWVPSIISTGIYFHVAKRQ
jgi:hypothetical protein